MVTATRLLMVSGGGGGFVNSLAYATLTRYGTTPVLSRGTAGEWDDDMIAGQQVFYDRRLGKWVMVYAGIAGPIASNKFKGGIAYSTDLLSWTKEAANPVFTASVEDVGIAAINIVQLPDLTYRLYHQVYASSEFVTMATSTDLITWNNLGHVFGVGAAGQWDDDHIFDQDPHLIGTTTYMWYGGDRSDLSRGIGLATAPDGVTFTRQGELINPEAGESDVSFGAPAVLITDATHYSIFHDAALTGSNTTRFIDIHTTTDGSTFSHTHQYLTGDGSGWDSVQVFDPAPTLHAGTLYLFYSGAAVTGDSTGLASDIGLATVRWP